MLLEHSLLVDDVINMLIFQIFKSFLKNYKINIVQPQEKQSKGFGENVKNFKSNVLHFGIRINVFGMFFLKQGVV